MSKKQPKDKPPHIEVETTPRGIRPLTQMDAEELVSMPFGKSFQLVPLTKRSPPQLKTYWKALTIVVQATGKWPSKEQLSNELKFMCGLRQQFIDWETGEVREAPRSISFAEMEHEEFCRYFDLSMKELAGHVGFDPLAFLEHSA